MLHEFVRLSVITSSVVYFQELHANEHAVG